MYVRVTIPGTPGKSVKETVDKKVYFPLLTCGIVAAITVSAAASVWKWTKNGGLQSEKKTF